MDTRTSRRSASRTLVETVATLPPARSRSQSRGRKPKSSKTPERNQPRSKSKTRKSPARKSAAKAESEAKPPRKTESKTSAKWKEYEDKPEGNERETSPLSPTAQLKEEIIRNSVSRFEDITAEAVTSVRKSSRLRTLAKKEELEQEVTTLLKENISEISQSKLKNAPVSWKEYLHLALVVFLILDIPIIPLALQSSCSSSTSCKAEVVNLPKTWRKYFALEQSLGYLVFFLLQIIISCVPLGMKGTNIAGNIRDYRCSGLASVLICCGGVSLIRHYFKDDFQSAAEKDVLPLVTAGLITALFFSLVLLLKGKYKPNGDKQHNRTNLIVDFWYGLEINPRVKMFDFKVTFLRSSLVLCILLNFIYLVKAYDMFGAKLPIPFAVVCFMQIIYCIDFLIFESSYLTSHMVNHEGTGYMTIMSAAIFPFIALTFTRLSFSGTRSEDFPLNMIPSIVLYVVGYVILRVSNYQKAAFKRNPHTFNYGDIVIGSGESAKLVCSGLWGVVRHPNYLGALLVWWGVAWAAVIAVGHLHWAILLASLSLSAALIYRVTRLEAHLSASYPLTYSRYASRVPRVVVPFVA